jgi:putative transcriptional regulator
MPNACSLIISSPLPSSYDMKSDLRHQLAEKMAGEITLSDSPGKALKKWRMSFNIPQGVLCERLEVSPSVISDYESGRRKSPGTAVVGKIVDTILSIDEANGGKYIKKFGKILYADIDDNVIYDIHDYPQPVPLSTIAGVLGCKTVCGSLSQSIFGYTIINSLNAITQLSSNEFNRIYGWSTERALIFTEVTSGKSPMVAIRVTPFKPRCVVLQGIEPELVHPLVPKMAERDHITVLCTAMGVEEIVRVLREEQW